MSYDTSRLKNVAVSESGLLFDPMNGAIYTTNPVGLTIVTALQAGLEPEAVKQRILTEFEAEDEVAAQDLFDFLGQLLGYEVIRHV